MCSTTHNLGYVISGLSRSGTTFLANVFQKAGYDMGVVNTGDIGKNGRPVGGGMEDPEFGRVNTLLQHTMIDTWGPGVLDERKEPALHDLLEMGRPMFDYPWPFVVKDPRFCDTAWVWNAAGYKPKHLFLCMRNPKERNASIRQMMGGATPEEQAKYIVDAQQTYYEYLGFFNTLLLCQQEDIPYTIVLYPRIGQDRFYTESVLEPFIKHSWDTVSEVWNTSLHHHRADTVMLKPAIHITVPKAEPTSTPRASV